MSRGTLTIALVAVLAGCCWPWVSGLAFWPMAPDSGTWIARSMPGADGWAEWVFATRHFNVGWRPLTALTFAGNYLVGGLEPVVYRVTDLGLHAAAIVLLWVTFRRLFPARPPWAALVAATIFGLHPVTAEVVPFLARRSYSLATVLGLAGLVLFDRGLRGAPPRSSLRTSLGAGLLIALACFANEASVLYAAVLPFMAYAAAKDGERSVTAAVRACVVPAVPVTLALVTRIAVVGGLGGYRLPEAAAERAWPIFESTWRGVAGVPAGSSELLATLLLATAGPYYAWRALQGRGLRLVLLAWLVVYALLYAGQGVWFPRQAYLPAVPFALLVAEVLASTVVDTRGARRLANLAPQLLLIGVVLWSSPSLRGPDPVRIDEWRSRDRLITRMYEELAACEEPATVQVVLHYFKPPPRPDALKALAAERELPRLAHQPGRWLRTLLRERDVELKELAFFEVSAGPQLPVVDFEAVPRTVELPAGVPCFVRDGGRMPRVEEGARTVPIPSAPDGRRGYLYVGNLEHGALYGP